MATVTAKVVCRQKVETNLGEHQRQALVEFAPDYGDGRNAEWAAATPHLTLSMTVNGAAATEFEPDARYTLTFTREDS